MAQNNCLKDNQEIGRLTKCRDSNPALCIQQLIVKKQNQEMLHTEADDGRNVGELSVANALRNCETGDSKASEEVTEKESQAVCRKPFEDRNEVLDAFYDSSPPCFFGLELTKRVVWEKRFFRVFLQFRQEPPRRREVHRPPPVGLYSAVENAVHGSH